jgi:tetratricopeptide (TPR) repeat protein
MELREQVRADLLDLATVIADLVLRTAVAAGLPEARREASSVLDEAESLFGTSCVLEAERHSLATPNAVGAVPQDNSRPAGDGRPCSAWDHFAIGRVLYRQGEIAAAEKEMDCALAMQPGALWPNFWKGNCAFRLNRAQDAVVAFSVCVAIAPEVAWGYANRGLAYAELGEAKRARSDFERALQLDSGLVCALRGRGLLHYRARCYAEALADFHRCLDLGADRAAACVDIAMVYLADSQIPEARRWAKKATELDPANQQALAILSRPRLNK